jgi:hypothetical protein
MAKELERDDGDRALAHYVCSPSKTGKTTSILPAFLESDYFTHYLYLAFENNAEQKFVLREWEPSANMLVAEEQGAAFAVECRLADCVRILLEQPDKKGPHKVPRNDDPPSVEISHCAMTELLVKHLGDDSKVLIHVDEHRSMCHRDRDGTVDKDLGAMFSRGVMQALASAHGSTTLVATLLEPPPISPKAASAVCRRPVFLPRVDIDRVMEYLGSTHPVAQHHPGLCFPVAPDNATRDEHRLLATLRLRFAMALDTLSALGSLHRPGSRGEVDEFVEAFADALGASDLSRATLEKAIRACPVKIPKKQRKSDPLAASLLMGMEDEEVYAIGRRLYNLVVLPNRQVSSTISHLVSSVVPEVPVFGICARRFASVLGRNELLISAPLEEAYLWVLACDAALHGALSFNRSRFAVKCTDIRPGRIFPGTNSNEFNDVSELESDVMYFADEPGRDGNCTLTHPHADMFFRSSNGRDVVLIDVTGGRGGATEKANKLMSTISKMQVEQAKNGITVHGVVLAPADTNASKTIKGGHGRVIIERGREAREMLGGLDQLFRYMTW